MQSNYFLSSGERKGISSNPPKILYLGGGCRIMAFRKGGSRANASLPPKEEELQNFLVVESCWEAEPEQVKAL